jgi:hypothetical protein
MIKFIIEWKRDMESTEYKNSNAKFKFNIKLLVSIMFIIAASCLVTYGTFFIAKTQSSSNTISTSCFSTTFTETSSINLTNSYSMSNANGLKTTPYTITITNTCDTATAYYLILSIKDGSFGGQYVNYSIDGTNSYTLSKATSNTSYKESGYTTSYILEKGTLSKSVKKTYNIRLWINDSTTYENIKGKSFEAQVKVVSVAAGLAS